MYSFIIFVVLLVSGSFAQTQSARNCKLPDKTNGKCTHFLECPSAPEVIKNKIRPEVCGFDGRYPIICCNVSQYVAVDSNDIKTKFENICNNTYSKYGTVSEIPSNVMIGFNVAGTQFPHMAALGFHSSGGSIRYECIGSLISEKFVLTVASCTSHSLYGEVTIVRLGSAVNNSTSSMQYYTVVRYYNHPEYTPENAYHDIALLELNRPVLQTQYVLPACLHLEDQLPRYGWSSAFWDKRQYLQEVYFIEVPYMTCSKVYSISNMLPNGIVEELVICAKEFAETTCKINAGSPLQVKLITENNFIRGNRIFGLEAKSRTCGASEDPHIFINVSHYIQWIGSIIFS